MAKPLAERQTAALSMSARLSDVRDLITETRAAMEAAQLVAEQQRARSLSLEIARDDALQARRTADDAEFDAQRHQAVLARLEAKAETLLADERTSSQLAAYEAVREEQVQLVRDLREHWPRLQAEMVALLLRMDANDAKLPLINGDLPKGKKRLESVEAEARGVPGNFMRGSSPIAQLAKLKLPDFSSHAMAWPKPLQQIDLGEEMRKQRLAYQEERAREAARWANYQVTAPIQGERDLFPFTTKRGRQTVRRGASAIAFMTEEGVADARTQGLTVERVGDNVRMGMPLSGVSF